METPPDDQSGAKYRGLLEAAPDAMVVVDQHGDIVLLNLQAEKQFGYRRDELVGQPVTTIIPVGFAERLISDDLRSAADALAQQIGTGIELSGQRRDGSEFPIEIMLSPLESAEGILVTAAIRNISARRDAEAQLLQAQKVESIGRLAGAIAHDFNNMLFVINGRAEMLEQDLAPERRADLDVDVTVRNVQTIRETGLRAAALTAQLLAFSRQQVISPRPIDPNAAIGALYPMVRDLIGENTQLVVRLDDAAGYVRADPGQLDQILVNLVVNARDAMPVGGTVTIETGNVVVDTPRTAEPFHLPPGPYVQIAVSDTGIGMDRATRERIFEPLFTTKEPGKGTGLGLATAHGIVDRAGGRIWVDSAPGVGSKFTICLPRVEPLRPTGEVDVQPTVARRTGTILVVEDQAAVRDTTTQMLARSGYRVTAVTGGADALALLGRLEEPVDVLVTDVVMANMSGIILAATVMDRFPEVGVVLMSGYTPETLDLERVTDRGAVFLPKPVTSHQLVDAVGRARAARRPGPDPESAAPSTRAPS
jgi:PAS domain S-box-containing protein